MKKPPRIDQSSDVRRVGNGFSVCPVLDCNGLGQELSPFLPLRGVGARFAPFMATSRACGLEILRARLE